MVLDKLSDSLKNTLKKITGASFVDEKLVNELVKDIQRALLQGDTNVKLVFDLTHKIKGRALKEEPPRGVTKKEFLVKIVYDELVNYLGGTGSKIHIKGKPFKIMLVGLFGNGKCVHKDSNLIFSDGSIFTAQEIYDRYKYLGETDIEDGQIISLNNHLHVPSFNPRTLKIEQKEVTHLWKLKSKELLKVNLDCGSDFSVKVTKEHPFFTLKNGQIVKKRADQLIEGDYVTIASKINTSYNNNSFFTAISKLDLNIKIDPTLTKSLNEQIKNKHITFKSALKAGNYSRNYDKFTINLKKGEFPIERYSLEAPNQVEIKHHTAMRYVLFPTIITNEFSELIGYLLGDGYLSKGSINFSTNDAETEERIAHLAKELFNTEIIVTKDKRRKQLKHLRINSTTLTYILNKVFSIPIGKKGRKLKIPLQILQSTGIAKSKFLQAYFDCDGHFSKKQRQIEAVSESKVLLQQIQLMLLQFQIKSQLSKKNVKKNSYARLIIGERDTVRFYENIGALINRKHVALKSYPLMTIKQGDGKLDLIPVGKLLKNIREMKGFTVNQLQASVSSYGLYENKGVISRTQLQKVIASYETAQIGNYKSVLEDIEGKEVSYIKEKYNQSFYNSIVSHLKIQGLVAEITNSPKKILVTNKGKALLAKQDEKSLLAQLKNLAFSDTAWVKVNKITPFLNDYEYVYDLTVKDNHSFIADGIIVHNTTSAGKLANFYKKRGLKVAVVQTDTWRPAAYEQLETLAIKSGVIFFGVKKEKSALKIYKEFEKEYSDFDLVIIDTAGRDALNDELISELNDINNAVKPDETLLVLSADLGQAAENQAKKFHDTCKVTGVLITKLEGTAKGGGALIACSITGAPVKFIGLGEKIDDLEEFKPEGFVGRLLGMGDLEALLEKARDAITEEDAQDLGRKLLKGEFNLIDLYDQMSALKKMGPLGKVMEMIPGMGSLQIPKEAMQGQEKKIEVWKYLMDSMTREELEDPDIITSARIDRISKGSGHPPTEVRSLLKQYRQSKKVVKMMKGMDSEKGMQKAMQKLQKGGFKI